MAVARVESKGKVSPLTDKGVLRVNGVLVSCYGYTENHFLIDLWFGVFRNLWWGSLDSFVEFSKTIRSYLV